MGLYLFHRLSELIQRKRKILINEKFVIFCFFLLFSSIIWYLNKLGGDYLVDLKLPIKVVYSEADKMLVEEWCNIYNLKETSVKGLISYKQELKKLCYTEIVSVPSTHYSGIAITKKVRKVAIREPKLFIIAFNKYARKKAKEIK